MRVRPNLKLVTFSPSPRPPLPDEGDHNIKFPQAQSLVLLFGQAGSPRASDSRFNTSSFKSPYPYVVLCLFNLSHIPHAMKRKLSAGAIQGPPGESLNGFLPTPKSSDPLLSPDRVDGHPSKIRRRGSKIAAMLRSLTTSGSSKTSQLIVKDHRPVTPDLAPEGPAISRIQRPPSRGLIRKVSTSVFRSPVDQYTVVHRTIHKSRPSIPFPHTGASTPTSRGQPTLDSTNAPTISTTNSSTNSGGVKFFHQGPMSTAKTSLDSKLSFSPPPASAIQTVHSFQHKRSSPDIPDLTPIRESDLDCVMPTVATVEKAVAAKIFLETYFNQILSGRPSQRSLRRRLLETDLYRYSQFITLGAANRCRKHFFAAESAHLRETRVLRVKGTRTRDSGTARYVGTEPRPSTSTSRTSTADDYENVRNLGKGSYGVVRLVRAKNEVDNNQSRKPVYAMKVIRKSAMVRTSQEGHLRAERDFLVTSEGSEWIVPLISSFQDSTNLYLVMEYMPGGDFLGYLIRQNILPEHTARHYVAEMIMCIEEAHTLRCIHRDVKPENFLIGSSGHLKISDFGLAFDGHWSHDSTYFNHHRYSLLDKLGIQVDGDTLDQSPEGTEANLRWARNLTVRMERHEPPNMPSDGEDYCGISEKGRQSEPLLNWRNRCGNRITARSIVGTSQYMAPEVVMGEPYDASLIREKENRLSSRRYKLNDPLPRHPVHGANAYQTTTKYVYPHDADDIKTHKFFRGIDWDRLHNTPPPFIPRIRTEDDTRYFEDEDEVSDWSASSEEGSEPEPGGCPSLQDVAPDDMHAQAQDNDVVTSPNMTLRKNKVASSVPLQLELHGHHHHPQPLGSHPQPHLGIAARHHPAFRKATPTPKTTAILALSTLPREMQPLAQSYVSNPFDGTRLRRIEREIERLPGTKPNEREELIQYVRRFGKRETRRPRDRLLRDRRTRDTVMKASKLAEDGDFILPNWTDIVTPQKKALTQEVARAFEQDLFLILKPTCEPGA
ncbi:kinase-like protein [Zalerion maritima]|uniref:non-specific serine/threonine protein kinase n=1 Tax=Zalerion maritima TaxID=339359 RepID=A0AAD5RPK4_9PEZI|nr:kinase-like protein [Zalerion maritima]